MILSEQTLVNTIYEGVFDALANGIERGVGRFFSKGYPEGKPNTIEEDIKGNGWKIMKVFVKEPTFACVAVCPDPDRPDRREDYLKYEDLVEDLNIYFKDKGSKTVAKDADARKSQYGYNGGAHLIEFYGAADSTLHEGFNHSSALNNFRDLDKTVKIDDVFPEIKSCGIENLPETVDIHIEYEDVPLSKGDHDTPDSGGYVDVIDAYIEDEDLSSVMMDALGMTEQEFNDAVYKYVIDNWDTFYTGYDDYNAPDDDRYEEMQLRKMGY